MLIIANVDDTLFLGPNITEIKKAMSELESGRHSLTCEEGNKTNVFSFLGVSITPDSATNTVTLTQVGLVNKILLSTRPSQQLECQTATLGDRLLQSHLLALMQTVPTKKTVESHACHWDAPMSELQQNSVCRSSVLPFHSLPLSKP
jgi:hypothetical protein